MLVGGCVGSNSYMSSYFYIDYIMILKTFDKAVEIDNIEDLTKLSNADRLKLFGFIYPNSMVKNYGKVNNNKSLTIGMIKLLAKSLEHQNNITTVIKELMPEDKDFIKEYIESDTVDVSDLINSERRLDKQPDTISKRKYLRDKDAVSNDFQQSLFSSPMDDLSAILQKILSE